MIIPHLTEHLHSSQNWRRDFVLIKLLLHFLTKLWQCFAFRAPFYGLKLGNSVWWKKVQIYRLKVVDNKMGLAIVNQTSNMSPSKANLQSSSLIHSSNNTPSMQLYLWLLNRREVILHIWNSEDSLPSQRQTAAFCPAQWLKPFQ